MAVMWMSFLLLLSVWLRAKVTFLQKYLVPAGIIAGTLGFALINLGWIGYPSPEGWVPLKVGDFGMISFHLFSFGFGIIGLGCFSTHTKGRSMTLIKGALWIDLLFWLFYGLQATVGYGITELYAKITGSDLTAATGFLAGFGFAFGPGQALSVGMSWQNDYGLPDCVSMGLAYAAAGFMVANFVGVPLANWGLRKGYATYGTKELSSDFLKGLRPEDKRVPACQLTTHSGNVDTFALHFAVAATVYGLGWIVCYVLKYFVLPPNYQTASFGFIYLYALFAGMIVRLVINHTAANAFYSDDAQNRILGTTIDYMIISALMAVSAATVMKYFIPFILVIVVCTLITLLGVLYLGRRVGSFGLERLLVVFGLVTGTAASGLALLRIVDSDFKTPAAAEVGLNNVYALIPLFPFLLLSVTMPGGFGISGMLIMHVVMIAVCAAILFAGHRMKIWGPRPVLGFWEFSTPRAGRPPSSAAVRPTTRDARYVYGFERQDGICDGCREGKGHRFSHCGSLGPAGRIRLPRRQGRVCVRTGAGTGSRRGGGRAFTADVCSAAQVEAMRDAVGRLFPSIDILIQCAGVFPDPVKLTEDSIETWLRTQDINVHGTFRLLHAFLPLMRARGGSVVAVASGAGKRPLPGYSGYSVSKAGLIMLLKSVAVEYAADGIRANSICPGPVESEMVDSRVAAESERLGVPAETLREAIRKTIPLGRMASVDDIVRTALFLASDVSSYLTGQSLNLSGGMITEV